nr:hypothetical protein [Corynebacterium striatum]
MRQAEDPEAKAAIARTASELIGDDDAVIFDNGTTAQAIAQRLAGRPITAMCLSLHSAAALGTKPGANIFVPGGEVEPDTLALPSVAVASALREFRADVVVLGRVRRRWNTGWRRRRMTMRRINAQRCARPRCQMRVLGTGVPETRYCRVPGSWYRGRADGVGPAVCFIRPVLLGRWPCACRSLRYGFGGRC